jgi:hypothetical protein
VTHNSPIQFPGAAKPAVGPIAQSVEQRTFNPWVDGSSPSGPTPKYFIGNALIVIKQQF